MEWRGVLAGVPTPFGEDESLELGGMEAQLERLVEGGVAGVVVLGPLGEGASLSDDEKRAVVQHAVLAAGAHVPVVAGTCETTTRAACHFAVDCERLGAHGLVVLPPCGPDVREALMHVRSVAASTELPVMVLAHPAGDGLADILPALGEIENIEAVAESAADPSRVPRLADAAGTRFAVVAGADQLLLYSVLHGAGAQLGTVAAVFPREAVELFGLAIAGQWDDALALDRRLAPLARLVADGSAVQTVKLAQHVLGVGSETVRAPRLPLAGIARDAVERAVREAAIHVEPYENSIPSWEVS